MAEAAGWGASAGQHLGDHVVAADEPPGGEKTVLHALVRIPSPGPVVVSPSVSKRTHHHASDGETIICALRHRLSTTPCQKSRRWILHLKYDLKRVTSAAGAFQKGCKMSAQCDIVLMGSALKKHLAMVSGLSSAAQGAHPLRRPSGSQRWWRGSTRSATNTGRFTAGSGAATSPSASATSVTCMQHKRLHQQFSAIKSRHETHLIS